MKKKPKRRSAVARALRSPNLKQQVIRDKTRYTRKAKHKKRPDPMVFRKATSGQAFSVLRSGCGQF